MQALRTLFNVAHRLHNVLGPSWVLVCWLLSLFVRNRFGPQLKVYFLKNIGAGNSSSSRPNNSFSTCHHTGNSGKISFRFGFESWLLLVGPFCVEST